MDNYFKNLKKKNFFFYLIFQETEYKLKVDELLNENEAYKLDCGQFAAQLTLINNTNKLEIEKLKIQVFD